MSTARISDLAHWRALLRLLWRTGRARLCLYFALVAASGLLPTAAILLTGRLAHAIPAAAGHAIGSAAARPAVQTLAALLACLAAQAVVAHAILQLSRRIDSALALEVHRAVAAVTLGTPGLAALEDPVLADRLQAIAEAERRDALRRGAMSLGAVIVTRIRGLGAFVVLFAFAWWAPLVLAAAWHLTNVLYVRTTGSGVTVQMSDGATRMRRAEYMRSLAVEAPAAKELRVFGLSGWVVGRYGDAWLQALRVIWNSRRASRLLTAATVLALTAAHAAVLGALAYAAAGGAVGGAALLVFVQAVIATCDLGVLDDWQWFLSQALAAAGEVERLGAATRPLSPALHLLPAPPAASPAASPATPRRTGAAAVRLDGVRFTYRGREHPVLDGLTLHVPAGQSLAIVGENGAGKSTLIKLLCGMYEPGAGAVAVDGAPPLQARDRIGVIFQDFVRYPLSLRENVGLGALHLLGDTPALEGALRDAGAGGLLARLGWDAVLSREFEGGADLSGGEWQRVALARALAAVRGGAGVLILDEPTAALDVRAETELFERFLEVTRGVTTILVSHRLSSVRRAGRIVVLEGGRIVEDGTHDALMRRGGRYAAMYALQAARFAGEEPDAAWDAEVVDA